MKNNSALIRESLIKQLKDKGADVPPFLKLIDDYCFYAEQVEEMKDDIRTKGRTYNYVSSVGKESEKENPCVKNVLNYTKQMLAILKDLGLTTANIRSDSDDEL